MKKLLFIICAFFAACNGPSDRKEKDITDSDEQNISPNQTVTPEEDQRKDSTGGSIIGNDTTSNIR